MTEPNTEAPVESVGANMNVPADFESRLADADRRAQEGRWAEAASGYRELWRIDPGHGQVNHGLGLAAARLNVAELGIPYFEAALAADAQCAQFWIDYVDSLGVIGRTEEAAAVLAYARQQGLDGRVVEYLAIATANRAIRADSWENRYKGNYVWELQHGFLDSDSSSAQPERQKVEDILDAFSRGDISAVTELAEAMTRDYPAFEFGWKALGAARQQTAHPIEALAPMRRATALSPGDVEARYNLAVVQQALYRFEEAEAGYRWVLKREPAYLDALSNLGVILQQSGRLEASRYCYEELLAKDPSRGPAWGNLAQVLQKLGADKQADKAFVQALAMVPGHVDYYWHHGDVLRKLKRADEAVEVYRQALDMAPGTAKGWASLGAALMDGDEWDQADDCVRRALEIDPESADAHVNRGVVLHQFGRIAEAEACYRKGLELDPDNAQAYFNLGVMHHEAGRQEEAVDCYQKATQLSPDLLKAEVNCGLVLMDLGRYEEAEARFKRGIELDPSLEIAHLSVAECLLGRRKALDSIFALRAGLELCPESPILLEKLATQYADLGRSKDALELCEKLLQINPKSTSVMASKADALRYLGRAAEAEEVLNSILQLGPGNSYGYSGVLFRLSELPSISPENLYAEHRKAGKAIEAPFIESWPQHVNQKDSERPLRVGIVSADLRNHTLAFLAEEVLAELSKLPGLCLHAFYSHPHEDDTTAHIRKSFAHWHRIAGLSDPHVFDLIRRNEIDVLIDLSGHTAGHRLDVFARRPAPIQATWIGYPATTGMTSIDYYIGDRHFLPRDRFASQFTEALVHLPACAPFQPSILAAPVNPLPALSNGYITFASFNRVGKISPQVVDLWCRLMTELPGSQLLLVGMKSDELAKALLARFAEHGFGEERVVPLPRLNHAAYQGLHNKVDIALDTFPYAGATTTLHALWMGVPTLTLDCGKPASREGAFALGHLGLEEFVATDEADFVKRGCHLSADLSHLAEIRASLRSRFSASALSKPDLVAAGLNQAIRIMWTRWCRGERPEFISVDGTQ